MVATQRANQPAISIGTKLQAIIDCAVKQRSTIAFFRADGNPAGPYQIVSLVNDGRNQGTRHTEDDQNRALVGSILTGMKAQVDQANPLQALDLAADWLAEEPGSKQMVIIDSGLQTLAPLRFEDNLLDPGTSRSNVVSVVSAESSIPTLKGIDVIWLGLGQTDSPQTTLTSSARNKESDLWNAILSRGVPASLDLKNQIQQQPSLTGLPKVSLVPIPPEVSASGPKCQPFVSTVTWHDATFIAETASLVNPPLARQRVASLARTLTSDDYGNIILQGTTANWGDFSGQESLAKMRAAVIRRLLLSLGVQPDSITSVQGLGSAFPGHVNEYDASGKWVEALASLNRQVIVQATARRC
jgi:outer membrane protein OmpA-like peptidoglycan-associated protein